MEPMYPAYNSQSTQLTADISAAAQNIPVADASVFPEGPNYATLGSDNDAEVVLYEAVDLENNQLVGALRGKSFTVARGWLTGSEVYHCMAADNLNAMMGGIRRLDEGKAGYTDGAWTPTILLTSGGITATAEGSWEIVGNRCFADFSVIVDTVNSPLAANTQISGILDALPIGYSISKRGYGAVRGAAHASAKDSLICFINPENGIITILDGNTSSYGALGVQSWARVGASIAGTISFKIERRL